MSLNLKILAISLAAITSGCSGDPQNQSSASTSQQDTPGEPGKPPPDKHEGVADPFGLQRLLEQPFEKLPEHQNRKLSYPDKKLDQKKLEGTWMGGSEYHRCYFRFNQDGSWNGLNLDKDGEGKVGYHLVSGKYRFEGSSLRLTIKAMQRSDRELVSQEAIKYQRKSGIKMSFEYCEVFSFANSFAAPEWLTESLDLLIPSSFQNENTLALFAGDQFIDELFKKEL